MRIVFVHGACVRDGADLVVAVAGREVPVAAGAATVGTVDVAGPFEVAVAGGAAVTVDDAVEPRPVTAMRVTSPFVARWSELFHRLDDEGWADQA